MQRAVNPHFCYAFSFAVALLVYLLGWSDLYPPLSFTLFGFIACTIALHIFFGIQITWGKKFAFQVLEIRNVFAPVFITIFIYILWTLEFLYEGGIPLLKIILKQPYDYRLFGIPSLHVFVVTFSSFYTIFLFHAYLSSRKRHILLLVLLNLIAALLIYNRGMLFFNLSGCFFVFLYMIRRMNLHLIYLVPLGALLLFYIFGFLGTLRVSREANTNYDNSIFLNIGMANHRFMESSIPGEFFWGYIYISSPLANLQTNVERFPKKPLSALRAVEMINNEILPDFISKRTNSFFGLQQEKEIMIEGPFNVSTIYSRSYSYLGWTGIGIMAGILLIIPIIYIKLVNRDSPFFLTGIVILNTLFLFTAFDNTLRFTGISFQLAFPILLNLVFLWFPRLREVFA